MHKKRELKLIVCFFIMLFLAACWDSVELENRAFVTAMAIEKDDSALFLAALEIPHISNEKSVIAGKEIKSKSAQTLSSAIYGIDTLTDKSLYLGQMKLAVLGKNILDDEKMFRQTIDTLAKDKDISRKLIILASESDTIEIIEAGDNEAKLTGTYIATYYKKNNPSLIYRQDLDRLSRDFAEKGIAIIPGISYENNKLLFSGAAVCENYKLMGWLNSEELSGLLWVYSQAKGAKLQWGEGEDFKAMDITKCKTRMDFYEDNGVIYACLNMDIEADGEEFQIEEQAKAAIKEQINTAYEALYNKAGVDGFNLLTNMKKKNPDLYKIYFENMEEDFKNIPVVLNIDIAINNTSLAE